MSCILVTAAGGTLAPLNIRLLRQSSRHKVKVVAVDARKDAAGRHFADIFSQVPAGTDPRYADVICDLVRRHHVDVVLPWSDEEAVALAGRRGDIEAAGAVLACVDLSTLKVMSSKMQTLQKLAADGVAVPDWSVAEDAAGLDRLLENMRHAHGEVAVKPVSSRGARDTYVIRNDLSAPVGYHGSREVHLGWDVFMREFRPLLDQCLPVMVMERLHAPAYDIDVLAMHGRILRLAVRERVNPAGIPFQGSYFRADRRLLDIAEAVTTSFGVSWLYDYDLMTDARGNPVVIEINPRPSGSIAASIMAGVPFYDDLMDVLRSQPLTACQKVEDGRLVVPYMSCDVVPPETPLVTASPGKP